MVERPIGFWLKLVDRLIDERFAGIIEEHGVTRRQWQLLGSISAGHGTVAELDAAIAPFLATGETSADHLAELVESDWLSFDGASFALTERGTIAFTALSEVVEGLRGTVAQGLSPEEYAAAVGALETMARNLGYTD